VKGFPEHIGFEPENFAVSSDLDESDMAKVREMDYIYH
jgi:hypothetical protein